MEMQFKLNRPDLKQLIKKHLTYANIINSQSNHLMQDNVNQLVLIDWQLNLLKMHSTPKLTHRDVRQNVFTKPHVFSILQDIRGMK